MQDFKSFHTIEVDCFKSITFISFSYSLPPFFYCFSNQVQVAVTFIDILLHSSNIFC